MAVLNAPVADFVFRRIAKVKDGGFYEANRQFIAPLPIPRATLAQQTPIGDRALALQIAHSRRRDLIALLATRMKTVRTRNKPETWLFAGIRSKRDWETVAPKNLDSSERRKWADQRLMMKLKLDMIQ